MKRVQVSIILLASARLEQDTCRNSVFDLGDREHHLVDNRQAHARCGM